MQHFKKYLLIYTIVPLLVLLTISSYYRFIVTNDYLVSYEGMCDPINENCFVDCEDEECTSEYYYTVVTRHATEIDNLCGDDITDCEAANICLPGSTECSITHCDLEVDGDSCEFFDKTSDLNNI